MADENPYRSPTRPTSAAEPGLAPSVSQGVWRDGKLLIMNKTATLPPRCARCNAPTDGRLNRQLGWHAPGWYLLIVAGLLIYVVAALIVRETATIQIGYCDLHRRKRLRGILIGVALFFGGIALMVGGSNLRDAAACLLIGIAMILGGLIYGMSASQVVTPKRIDKRFVWLKHVSPEYLAELPAWEETRG